MGFAATVFLSAFLLFQVQPLIGKCILPWFGGSTSVWTVCILFFQVFLFAGYLYAHLTSRRFRVRTQFAIHMALMVAALALLPIVPTADWKPTTNSDPTFRIVLLLTVSIGLPYFVLSSTGPLLQAWFRITHPGRSPYRLYALSNTGSLLALVSYPFVFEPAFDTRTQAVIWSWLFGGFVLSCAVTALPLLKVTDEKMGPDTDESTTGSRASRRLKKHERNIKPSRPEAPTLSRGILWFCLAMVPSVMLLATTNQVCTDVAVVPFLWVLPLTLYLLSFILCFADERWYSRRWFGGAWVIAAVAVCAIMLMGHTVGGSVSLGMQVVIYFSALFCCCMICHGELVRLKPDPRDLTVFYLVLAAGGAAGGLFVGLVAPFIFSAYLELHLALLGCSTLILVVIFRDQTSALYRGQPRWAWRGMVAGLAALAIGLIIQFQMTIMNIRIISRNFYGVLRVEAHSAEDKQDEFVQLIHGRTMHGMQYLDPKRQRQPTAYFGSSSGIGLVLQNHRPGQPKRVGIVGLGIGTLASYANPGDWYCFYEINPEVVRLAEELFLYLPNCPADVRIVTGDARISLEQQPGQEYDVLVLDAFASDAIPVHLLTREALAVYLDHLKDDGILAVHISNRHLDLRPVIAGLAEQEGLYSVCVVSKGDEQQGMLASRWNLLSRQRSSLEIGAALSSLAPPVTNRILWTDTRSNLFQILRLRGD